MTASRASRAAAPKITLQGLTSGEEPATWGQQAVWGALEELGEHAHQFNLEWTLPVPEGADTDRVLASVGWLVARHESLRTLFHRDARGELRQRVLGSLDLPVAVTAAAADTDTDTDTVEATAGAAARSMTRKLYDHAREIPFRVCVVTAQGRPHTVVLGFSHMAADFDGTAIAADDLALHLRTGTEPDTAPPQPRQLARHQTSDQGRAQSARAVDYWTSTLNNAPVMRTDPADADPQRPRFWRASMRSRALPDAVGTVATAAGVSTTAVLLAAVANELGARTSSTRPCLMVMVGNRARAPFHRIVSPMAIEGLFMLDLDPPGVPELAGRAWQASLKAYRHAQFHKADLLRSVAQVETLRAPGLNRACWFNDLRFDKAVPESAASADPAALAAATEKTEIGWVAKTDDQGDETLAFHVYDREDAIEITLTADTEALGPDAVIRCLRSIEALLVDAATQELHRAREASDE